MPDYHAPSAPPLALHVVLNAGSGHDDAQATYAHIGQLLGESGRPHRIELVERGADIASTARRAVAQAIARGGAVVAAGGDGTINAVAQAAHDAGCPMGVLPQGTFNYFSRTHGIPLDTAAATHALLSSQAEPVQVGLVNERVFLVNASLGLYPELLEDREQYKQRYGRNRLVAMYAALATALRPHRQLRLHIDHGGSEQAVRTDALFVGNNRLQLTQVGLPEAQGLAHGRVAAVMLRPTGSWGLMRLLWHAALGRLADDERVESFQFRQMTVRPGLPYGAQRVKVAIDGEVGFMRAPLLFRVSPRPLYLLKPPRVAVQAPAGDHAAASV